MGEKSQEAAYEKSLDNSVVNPSLRQPLGRTRRMPRLGNIRILVADLELRDLSTATDF
ncbi:hypothetical protein [Nostoc sp.]|uniref:hypothetical protein n=1 Tax=Nostoc sp. TaxID=1180 RepID=UPI002FF61207